MSSTYSSWRSLRSPNMRSSSTSEKPITAFSGVRSSCDMLARNSDLWRPATSSSCVLRSSSRNTRALWMATAAWLASVSSSSTVGAGSRPGAVRRTTSTPTDRCSRSSGTATSERQPWRQEHVEVRVGGLALAGPRPGASGPPSATRPTNVSGPIVRRAQRLGQLVARAGARAQHEARRTAASAKIDPPSPPDSSTARVTIVASASSSTSRLALTAWLTSPSARSSCISCTLRMAIAPWAANVVTMSSVRASNGSTSVRMSTITPTTRSSASIGTPSMRPLPAERARLVPLVARVRRRRPRSAPGAARPTRGPPACPGPRGTGCSREVAAVLLRAAERGGEPVHVAVEPPHLPDVRAAEVDGVAHDGLEDRRQLERRAPDRLEHLARRGLLLDHLGQVAREAGDLGGGGGWWIA